jgi:3-phenylpropionate/trans-cinnamate dioxygenase ferredoxin component
VSDRADGFERVTDDSFAIGELRAARLADGTAVCIGNADGQFFAVHDECPHAAFPLSSGTLLPGGRLECGWHGAQFDCRTGNVLEGPAEEPLVRYAVRVESGGVWVRAGSTIA